MIKGMSSRRLVPFRLALPAKGWATGIHVAISMIVFLVLLYFIVVEWYPPPFFAKDGGWQGIRLMFAIDVVLGPTLTFLVFNPGKARREIIMDLSVIALFQFAALAWGVNTVYQQRPAVLVESNGTFSSVVPMTLEAGGLPLAGLKEFDGREPPVVFQRVPSKDAEIVEAFRLVGQGLPFNAQSDFYERFDQNLTAVFAHAAAFEGRAIATRTGIAPKFRLMRQKHGADVGFLPFQARHGTVVLVISRQGEIVDSMDY